VQEFCNKGTLSQAVERGLLMNDGDASQPNLLAVLQTAGDVARAMNYLHQFNVIHGDLTCKCFFCWQFSVELDGEGQG
jgi:tRNA A-37 threonylcarbamoyl transferase component Bud32